MNRLNIAIDGPAGAGKSTIAKAVAGRLGILCLDTGAMYRALAWKAVRLGIDPGDAERVCPMLDGTEISVRIEGGAQRTLIDGEDVSGEIRTQLIAKGASDISAIPAVRIKLAESQREIARHNDLVMEGRDIGSNVLPDSKHKFYVTASSAERARRRLAELREKGLDAGKTLEAIQREIEERDHNDSHRDFAPLVRMPDAVLIDTTNMTPDEAVNSVIAHIREG